MDLGRPTLEDCRNWRSVLASEWGGSGTGSFQRQVDDEEALYFQRFSLGYLPAGEVGVRTGSAPADADAAIESLVPVDLAVKVRPRRSKKKYREQAEVLALWGKGALAAWRRKKDVLRLLATDQVIRRVAVARVLIDDRLWPPRPDDWDALDEDAQDEWLEQHRERFPLILERRNPRYCYWRDLDDGTLAVMVEDYPTTVLEAKAAFGIYPAATRILKDREPNDPVRVADIWIGLWRCLLLDDEPLFVTGGGKYKGVALHGYPCIPYLLAPFRELGFERPAERYRGMLTNAAGLYPMEAQVLTMHMYMLKTNAWRTWITRLKDGRDIQVLPGTTINLDPRFNESIEMLAGEAVPRELLQMAQVTDAYISRNSVSGGPRTQESTRSAQQVYAIQALRQQKVQPAKESFEALMGNALGLAVRLLETRLQEPITLPVPGRDREGTPIGEVTLTPSMVNGYYDGFEVKSSRRLDPALLEQAKTLMAFAMNNWMPLRQSIELSGLTDAPQEWLDELLEQSIDRLPAVIEAAAAEWADEWYDDKDDPKYMALMQKLLQAQQQQQAQAAGAAPMPGAPGIPSPGGMQPQAFPQQAVPDTGQMLSMASGMRRGRAGGAPGKYGGPNNPGGGQ